LITKNILISAFITLLLSSYLYAQEEKSFYTPNYSFKNISVNYLDWSTKTENESPQKDFAYLEFEAGAGFDWGDFYMFLDIENPTDSYTNTAPHDLRFAFKPVLDIKIANSNWSYHIQDYSLTSDTFFVHNFINAIAYKYSTDGFWIRPFLGIHYQESTYYSGFNGYMFGWTFLYDFSINNANFSIAQWHENTFDRDKTDYKKDGFQGALSAWYKASDEITMGLQYRYADQNLGYDGYQDGIIYSLKYNF